MLYSYKGHYPEILPNKIRLSNRLTRNFPYSDEELIDAGYVKVLDKPEISSNQKIEWSGTQWLVLEKSYADIEEDWNKIRKTRDEKIKEIEWRYNRYYRHQRLGLAQVDTIENLDTYVQALADITKQENPYDITWPSLQEANLNGT